MLLRLFLCGSFLAFNRSKSEEDVVSSYCILTLRADAHSVLCARSPIVNLISLSTHSRALRKIWSFPLKISLVNVTKSAVSCGFGHSYRRKFQWKTSGFAQWGIIYFTLENFFKYINNTYNTKNMIIFRNSIKWISVNFRSRLTTQRVIHHIL